MRQFVLIMACVLVLCGCSVGNGQILRSVEVEIPTHPWEKASDVKMWYYICWNAENEIKKKFVDGDTRAVRLSIPTGQTVVICAYPLGEMLPFGCAVTPMDEQKEFQMDQDQGYVADLLLSTEVDNPGVVERINWHKVVERAALVAEDWRQLDDQRIVKDALNGKMQSDTFKTREKITVPSFAVTSGTWISESVHDGRFIFAGNESSEIDLPIGVTRMLHPEKNLELRIVVDESGGIFQYQRQALVSSLNQPKGLQSEPWNL